MKAKQKNREVDLQVTSFSKKGNGIGRVEQTPPLSPIIVEVPFTMPGDVVRARLLSKRSGIYHAKLEEILSPAPERIASRCIHFGTCGGCRLQQLSHEMQLGYKEDFVRKLFAKFLSTDTKLLPIASGQPWHYRNKMEYTFSSDASGKKYLGLNMDSSKGKVLNLSECHLTHPWFIDGLKAVKRWWEESDLDAYHLHKDTGSLRTLIFREGQRTGDRMVLLTTSGNPDFALHQRHLDAFIAFVREAIEPITGQLSIFLRIQQIAKGMATNMYEMLLYGPDHIQEILHIKSNPDAAPITLTFNISPSAFFQPNTQQAEQLYGLAMRLIQPSPDTVVYDLYCGTGALGLCIAKQVKQVIGIELSPEAVLDARSNVKQNGFENVTILSGSVSHILQQTPKDQLPPPDIVMVDPPRAGLDPEAIKQLLQLFPRQILYISCNPVTQAANIEELIQQGYRIAAIQPVDQFPQTYHVENIVVLERS